MSQSVKILVVLFLLSSLSACSTRTRNIVAAGLVGSVVGAGVGYTFVHHGREKQYQTRNTIITGVAFGLITIGLLSWHFRELQDREVEISGKYSRHRLCDSAENPPAGLLSPSCSDYTSPRSIGQYSVELDENTRWVLPRFRKALQPARSFEEKSVESYYVWEVVKPGFFITKDRQPEYFLDLQQRETTPQDVSN